MAASRLPTTTASHTPHSSFPVNIQHLIATPDIKTIDIANSWHLAGPDPKMDPSFIDVVNRFGFQLQALTMKSDEPTGLCAMNIYQCLSMVAAGSKDGNLAAFGQALGFDADKLNETLQKAVQLDAYSKQNTAVDFSSAASIWHREDFVLEKPWLETMQNLYQATIGPLQIQPINEFIFKETKGKFKDLIKPGDLAGAVLMLVTCLYFKAKWQNPFDKAGTMQNSDFHTFDGKKQVCAMMTKVDKMEYTENKTMQVCFLPYQNETGGSGPQWKAAVILPKLAGIHAMHDILTKFSKDPAAFTKLSKTSQGGGFFSGPSAGHTTKISLSLPRF